MIRPQNNQVIKKRNCKSAVPFFYGLIYEPEERR